MKAKLLTAITATTALTATLSIANVANAASLSYTASYQQTEEDKEYVPYEGYGLTDIKNALLSIQKFDSSLGTLDSVMIDFTGSMIGDAQFESRDSRPQTVTVDLSGLVTLTGPNDTTLFDLNPTNQTQYNVSRYDGRTDFAGTSGRTIEGLKAEETGSKTLTDASSLSSFVGSGSVNFSFSSTATSVVKGSGNIVSGVNTYSKAGIKVTYNYSEAPRKIPEPSVTLGLGLLAGFGLLSQKKRVFKKA